MNRAYFWSTLLLRSRFPYQSSEELHSGLFEWISFLDFGLGIPGSVFGTFQVHSKNPGPVSDHFRNHLIDPGPVSDRFHSVESPEGYIPDYLRYTPKENPGPASGWLQNVSEHFSHGREIPGPFSELSRNTWKIWGRLRSISKFWKRWLKTKAIFVASISG